MSLNSEKNSLLMVVNITERTERYLSGGSGVVPIYLELNLLQLANAETRCPFKNQSHSTGAYFHHCSFYSVPQWMVYFVSIH